MNKVGIAFLILFLMVATPLWVAYRDSPKPTNMDPESNNYYYADSCNTDAYICYNYEYMNAGTQMENKMEDVYDNLANWSDMGQKSIDWMKRTIGWAADTVTNIKDKVKGFWAEAKGWFSS